MNFVSIDFFIFFMVVFSVFFALPDRFRNLFLLAASYFFYGYWSIKYLCLLIFTMTIDYWLALRIYDCHSSAKRRFYLLVSLFANLGLLFVFKYFNLFASTLAAFTGSQFNLINLILPFGISFYTFHAMSYIIDVYRGVIPAERNFVFYSGYVMFFPQLVAGPIARASHLLHQFSEPKRLRLSNISEGLWWIGRGYIMKMVLADNISPFVDAAFGNELHKTPFLAMQAVYLFAFQIYFDFAGYTDIARGIAKVFDYDLTLNFNRPYIAASVTEFWKRWHISLSTWLRDYLYISLGGNRRGSFRTYANLMITMLLGGLWHGGSWTFLAWGALHGSYLVVERMFKVRCGRLGLPYVVKWIWTFHLVCFAWIFFRAETFNQARDVVGFCFEFFKNPMSVERQNLQAKLWLLVIGWMCFEYFEARYQLAMKFFKANWMAKSALIYSVVAFLFLFAELNPKAFIYFQF
jgi:alginate O-acetyltransferase complex protein AlgI